MKTGYKPKEGYDWNPLLKLDRNGPCVCGSGKKYKKCHLPIMPSAIKIEDIDKLKKR